MDRHVTVPLLETVVLSHIVEVISSDDDCSLHLHLDHGTSEDATPDRDITSEWALLVNVFALDSLTRDLETETNISGISQLLLWYLLLQF